MKTVLLVFLAYLVLIAPQDSFASDHIPIHTNPQSYILNRLQTHNIVFLGTRHKQPAILNFISEIITVLHDSGVTHIGLEVASDQQGKIDQFMNTGAGLSDIKIHSQIDCPEYRNLFKVIRGFDQDKRPVPVALDLPKSGYKGKISRDEYGWPVRSPAFSSRIQMLKCWSLSEIIMY